jgi:hypothetical protein
MAGSFKRIDYRLRPAKHVERLMLCDAFRRLKFAVVESYQYVGMGSVYFSDFALFHKALGIREMYSIEQVDSEAVKQRFNDNRPFSNIEILWGKSGAVLPGVDLSRKSILWLDYDGRMDLGVLNDISSVAARISSGSVLTFSVQCLPDQGEGVEGFDFDKDDKTPLLTYATHVFGKDRLHQKWEEDDLAGWGTARLFWELATNELESALLNRNGIAEQGKIHANQIMHFHYSDGAYMLTIAWVFFSDGDEPAFNACAFPEMDFFRPTDSAFKIALPLLTLRELRKLEQQLPGGATNPELGSIPAGDARKFISLYRYFPNFAATAL